MDSDSTQPGYKRPRKGPKTYKGAKGKTTGGKYGGHGQAKAQGDNVAKKVKKIAASVMPSRNKQPGSAAYNRY